MMALPSPSNGAVPTTAAPPPNEKMVTAASSSVPHAHSSGSGAPDSPQNYEFLSVIGSGSFGRICKVKRIRDGAVLARKEIEYRRMKDKERQQLVQEVNILRDLRHPNIVRYLSRYVDRGNYVINIIMEYCEGGDLSRVIKLHRQTQKYISEETIWTYFAQLAAALHECHHVYGGRMGEPGAVLHRDIKPDNVFLDSLNNAKLGDFGLSTLVMANHERNFAKTFVGTPFYMSPELVREQSYNEKSDIWSLGCLLYELCALEPPFRGQTHRQLNDAILNVRYPDIPRMYSDSMRAMIRRMLQLAVRRSFHVWI
ncbi:Nek2 bound To hybrid compound 21 [Blastocladiella britannica]|nr:Nek2 bound To hybrid compound 21 [Blastocladiella britannica]